MKNFVYVLLLMVTIVFFISQNNNAQSAFPNIQITNSSYNPSETFIAMLPGDPTHLLVGANTIGVKSYGTSGFYYSSNSAQSWSGSDAIESNYTTVDPTVAFSSNGNCYYCFLSSNRNGSYTNVVKSANSYGTSWETGFSEVSGTKSDKPFMYIDNMVNSPNKNNIYVAISDVSGTNSDKIRISMAVANSSDPSFSGNDIVSGSFDSFSPTIASSPNGKVYVVFSIGSITNTSTGEFETTGIGFNTIAVSGGNMTVGTPIQIATASQIGTWNSNINRYVLKENNSDGIRVNSFPSIVVDPSNGTIYVTWADNRNGDPDIYLIIGTPNVNGNITWSSPKRVNDDPVGNGKDQWLPIVNVTSDHAINIAFYDSREDPNNLETKLYLARSTDGGSTFDNFPVSDVPFIPTAISGGNPGYMGDYISMVSTTSDAYPCWMDNRTGKYQLYTADIKFGTVNVTADQVNASSSRLTGTNIGLWNGSSFQPNIIEGTPITFPSVVTPSWLVLQGDESLVENNTQKYYQWNAINDVTNFHQFIVSSYDNSFTSHFNITNNVTVQSQFLEGGSPGGYVDFMDPWLANYQDPNYGNTYRNQSMSASFNAVNFSANDLGTATNYKGVFLSQPIISGKPYYSVRASLTQTFNGYSGVFQSWSSTPTGSVSFQQQGSNPSGYDQKAVVFNSAGATVTANYKGVHLSNDASAFSNNSQRKLVWTSNGWLSQVYTSVINGVEHAWIEHSSDGGSTWFLGNNGKPLDYNFTNGSETGSKDPSIDYYDNSGNIILAAAFQVPNGSHYSIYIETFVLTNGGYFYSGPQWVDDEPNNSYSIDANPNIVFGGGTDFIVTIENSTASGQTGIDCKAGTIDNNTGAVTIYTTAQHVNGTDGSSKNASVYCNKTLTHGGIYTKIAWEENSQIEYSAIDFAYDGSNWYYVPATPAAISTNSYPINESPSIIEASDSSARVVWYGYEYPGSSAVTVFRDPGYDRFWYFGSNVRTPQITLTNNNSDYYVIWNEVSDNSTRFTDSYSLSTIYNLNTSGQAEQLSNGADRNSMYASVFTNSSLPYYYATSPSIGSIDMNKTSAAAISNIGRGGVVSIDSVGFYFSVQKITLDNQAINFEPAPDTLRLNNINQLNKYLISKPFTLNNNSSFYYSVRYGVTDSAKAKNILVSGGSVSYTLSLIDASTGTAIGSYPGITFSASGVNNNNIPSYRAQTFQVSTNGISSRLVRLKLTAKVLTDSNNTSAPEFALTSSYSDLGNAIQKSGAKQISYEGGDVIKSYALEQNYPNPFNPTTIINYQIPNNNYVTLKVYDILGNLVKTLVDGYKTQGSYSINFNASNLASGIYFYQLKAGNFISTKKLLLLK